jgi:hypothetical protein
MGVDLGQGLGSFLEWVIQVEQAFTELFEDPPLADLQTPRYWIIQSMSSATPRTYELMSGEINVRVGRRKRIAKAVHVLSVRLEHDGPVIAVGRHERAASLPHVRRGAWEQIVGQAPVLLAVPLRGPHGCHRRLWDAGVRCGHAALRGRHT